MGKSRSRFVRAAIVGVVVGVAALLVVLPSASATPKSSSQRAALDLSSVSKINAYIRSLGVDPSTVVIQRGARNYAGPSCPGAGWNCTASTKVVQLSSSMANGDDGGQNRFVCRKDRGSGSVTTHQTQPQSCLIVQGSGTNSATCSMQTFGSTGTIDQTCFITQGGTSNTANATLVAGMASGSGGQTVNQRIEVKQTNGSGGNTFTASETAGLGVAKNAQGADGSASQNFHQVICGNQSATGSGSNTAAVTQQGAAAAAYANAGNVSVAQNTDSVLSTCTDGSTGNGGAGLFDDIFGTSNNPLACPLLGDSSSPKTDANSCSRIQQVSESGKNRVTKHNQSNLLAAAVDGATTASVDQGTFAGGIDSTQDQMSLGGVNAIVDRQAANQVVSVKNVSGFVGIHHIEDPRCCAGGHQSGGGSADSWSINQDLNQKAFIDGQLPDPNSFGGGVITQEGADHGFCTTDGNCAVSQHASNNVDDKSNSDSGSNVDIAIQCFASGSEFRARAAGPLQEGGACQPINNNID